jgi:hypothetical protein
MEDILTTVAKTFDTTVDQLISGRRKHATARTVAAFIAFEDGLYRQTEIAAALRIRHHNSVSAIVRRCRTQFAQLVAECRRLLPRARVAFAMLPLERNGFYDSHTSRRFRRIE